MNDVASYLIVYNPVAGRGRGRRLAAEVASLLERVDRRAETYATGASGDAERVATQAINDHRSHGPLCVVACGGDGTVHEVANAVARSTRDRSVMGLAPAGRCNDFAGALGIDTSPRRIVDALTTGTPSPVDLGRIGDRYFCTVAALGFDAAVSRFVNDMKMPLRGPIAYVYGTLRVLLRYRTPALRLSGDFDTYEGPVLFAASGNTAHYGGAMRIAPEASPFDGRLDVCVVTGTTRWRVLRMLRRVMSGQHVDLPEVRILRTPRLNVDSLRAADQVEVWADGEPIGRLPTTIECVPDAVRILLPAVRGAGRSHSDGDFAADPVECDSPAGET